MRSARFEKCRAPPRQTTTSGGGSVFSITASSGTSAGRAPPVGTNPGHFRGSMSLVRKTFWKARTGGNRLLQYGGWLTLTKRINEGVPIITKYGGPRFPP